MTRKPKKTLVTKPKSQKPGDSWFHHSVVPLVEELAQLSGGRYPLVWETDDPTYIGAAWFHSPTMYPAIKVPNDPEDDWDGVAFGLMHLIRSMRGIPELVVDGTKADERIAHDLNGSIQRHGAIKELWERGFPYEEEKKDYLQQAKQKIAEQSGDELTQLWVYLSMRSALLEKRGVPTAKEAFSEFANKFPDEAKAGFSAAEVVDAADLTTPHGVADTFLNLLKIFNFDLSKFGFETQHLGTGEVARRNLSDALQIVGVAQNSNHYNGGIVYTRCFLQEGFEVHDGVRVRPLAPSSAKGTIQDIQILLAKSGFLFTPADFDKAIENFQQVGHAVLVHYEGLEGKTYEEIIDQLEQDAEPIANALAVISNNPVVPLCAYAGNKNDSGVKFFMPNDPIITHMTSIPGPWDAFPDLEAAARTQPKMGILLSLYRASLREHDLDKRMLFQLILLEEASDTYPGKTLAKKVRAMCKSLKAEAGFAMIAAELGVPLPKDKDVIDGLVKLRNAAAHNGIIDAASLKEYGGSWVVPWLADKALLHRMIDEAIRFLFMCMVGHSPDDKAIKITV